MSDNDERNDSDCSEQSIAPDERLQRSLPERIPKLFLTLAIQAKNIQHIANGLYNVVFGFTDVSQIDQHECVLRVRIDESDECTARELKDTAAIMDFLSTHVARATKITHMDTTNSNPLLRPYTIQARLPGIEFGAAWDDMTLDDHTRISKLIMDELAALDKIAFPNPGRLAASSNSEGITLRNLRYHKNILPLPEDPSITTVEDWLSHLLDWQTKKAEPGDLVDRCLSQVKEILQSMSARGYFANLKTIDDCVLDHGDLHQSNVIVAREGAEIDITDKDGKLGEWTLTGFIDWDSARSIPRILSRPPQEWIWCDHLYEDDELVFDWTGHLDFVPEENWKSMPDHMKELKRRVDEYACSLFPDYVQDAYGRGRWIRRVAKFAMEGFTDAREYKMLEWMVAEWAKVEVEDAVNTPLPDVDVETGL